MKPPADARSHPVPTQVVKIGAVIGLALLVAASGWRSGWLVAQSRQAPLPTILPEKLRSGRVTVTPTHGVAGEFGTWTVSYRVGETRIRTGGGLRVQLPEPWHTGIRVSAFRLQATNPRRDHYVSARCSNPAVLLQTIVEKEEDTPASGVRTLKPSNLTDRMGYYIYVVRVVVTGGEIGPGETLSLIYGDRSRGSRGMRAGVLASGPEPAVVGVDTEGLGQFRLHADAPRMSIAAGAPAEMLVTSRSQTVLGQQGILHVALVDEHCNPAKEFTGVVAIRVASGQATTPSQVQVEGGRGWAEASFTPAQPGILRFDVSEPSRMLQARSNPVEVLEQNPRQPLYWGDLHSHSRQSGADGAGTEEDAYAYARRISGLDFYALTDHVTSSEMLSKMAGELSAERWEAYRALADRFYVPGTFATLPGYAASFGSPYGHHNVYFRGTSGSTPLPASDDAMLPQLWKALRQGEALTIPTHTLKTPAVVDWQGEDEPGLRRNFEIYSAQGLNETYDTNHPLAFEQSLFNPFKSAVLAQDPFNQVYGSSKGANRTSKTGMSAQRAWEEGFGLSTIASSDDHRSQPGQPQYGLAAVRAASLTREGIFDGLLARRTYGTTGVRIILDFEVDGVAMGGELHRAGSKPLRLRGRAIGTDVIDALEVLRLIRGQPGFNVIYDVSPAKDEVSFSLEDREVTEEAVYYLRVRQRKLVRERIAMAWSSPIWVKSK